MLGLLVTLYVISRPSVANVYPTCNDFFLINEIFDVFGRSIFLFLHD